MGIAKLNTVKKARKDQGECGRCKSPIAAGDAYLWWTTGFRSKAKSKRCEACGPPPLSDRESNYKRAAILAASEDFHGTIIDCLDREAIVCALESLAEALQEAASMFEESADSIEEGFGHETSQSEEQREHAAAVESAAEDVESAASELDEEPEEGESAEDYIDRLRDEAIDAANDNEPEI